MRRITDPEFRYVPAAATDIRKTFARVRREMARTRAASGTVLPLLPAQRAVQQRLDDEDRQARRRGRTT